MRNALFDLALATRSLARQPGFTLVVIATLALGIGSTTAIFTLLDAIVLSPLPFHEQERLVTIAHAAPARGLDDAGQCAAWHFTYEEENRVFEDIGMYRFGIATITGVGEPEVVPATYTTSGTLRALRLSPVLGRLLGPEDEAQDAPLELMLGYSFWQTRFAGASDVLGQSFEVNGSTWSVAGVLPRDFRSLEQDSSVILPLRYERASLFVGNIGASAVARLRPGVTLHEAHNDLARMLPMAWEKFPGGPVAASSDPASYSPVLQVLRDDLAGTAPRLLWLLQGGVAIVLLIACANIANLMLVRSDERTSEMAVRVALGASRRRIAWEYLKESLILGAVGGGSGLLLGHLIVKAVLLSEASNLPRLEQVSMSPGVVLFAAGVSMAAAILFGSAPALKSCRTDPASALRAVGASGGGRGSQRFQDVLATTQLALALVLLVATGLMLRSVLFLAAIDPGFNPADVLSLRLTVPSSDTDGEGMEVAADTHALIARRLSALPGVDVVGLSNALPMDGFGNVNPFYAENAESAGGNVPLRGHKWIGPDYFEALQIPLLVGRTFTEDEIMARFPGAVLSESLAREYFGTPEAAIGQRVAARPEPVRWHEVIGVVPDILEWGATDSTQPIAYWPQVTLAFWQGSSLESVATWSSMSYAIRSDRVGTEGLLEDVRDVVWSVDSNLPLRAFRPLAEMAASWTAQARFTLLLVGGSALMALILACVGIYGVIAYGIVQRSRELAIRVALGAQTDSILRLVLRRAAVICGLGAALGLVPALSLTRLMSNLTHGTPGIDPLTYVLVPILLIAVGLFASYLPARRAATTDPLRILERA